ncbi:apolipoN-acyltransferase domain protein [Mycobacteroides abscessus subsp. bolletii 1513]|uniref:ApolipoN-acyltransferase domain protein n=1 Tax=Mycobacteroides abscessus subsp. bolletii 1513 TaxID=1299321 RepID=X8DWN8_9MYCO|nr:apolipoN-acyltransferase domain protein [Mycobacteroides abscessus subsp. bolletii 1513]
MPSVLLPGVCVCLVLFAMAISWQQVRHASHGATDGRTVTVAAVQGNVPGWGWTSTRSGALCSITTSRRPSCSLRMSRPGRPRPQFVVWPENSSDIDPIRNADAAEAINEAAQAIGCRFLWVACCGTRIPPRTTEVDQLDHRVGPEHRPRRAS